MRRRRRIVERAGANARAERIGNPCFVFVQIGTRHRAADALEIGGDLAADVAAIKIAQAGIGELIERRGERGLLELAARFRRFAAGEEGLHKARRGFQFGIFVDRERRLAARDRVALARMFDGGLQQYMQRQPRILARLRFGRLESECPARHRARHRERGKRAARRNLVLTMVAIELPRRF